MDPLEWETRYRLDEDPPNLTGLTGPFFGAHSNCFKIGHLVLEAVEDPNDGYRSMLDDIRIADPDPGGWFDRPLDVVVVCPSLGTELEGFEISSAVNGHVWLRIGTDTYDNYYPVFTFDYRPQKGAVAAPVAKLVAEHPWLSECNQASYWRSEKYRKLVSDRPDMLSLLEAWKLTLD